MRLRVSSVCVGALRLSPSRIDTGDGSGFASNAKSQGLVPSMIIKTSISINMQKAGKPENNAGSPSNGKPPKLQLLFIPL